MRFCLNVHGDLLCNGPQGHEGGCVFMPGWKLAREIEDALAKMVAYAGATTNELRETRGAAEAAEAALADTRRQVEYVEGVLMRDPFDDGQRRFAAELLRRALAGDTEGAA